MAVSAGHADAVAFVEKWRARWPEWGIAQVFVPAAQRPLAEHWFALLQEWGDAASTGEPAPGLAKLAWWREELQGWSKGARRHPLGARLMVQPLDWAGLADALPALAHRGAQVDAAGLDRLARALSRAETALFDEASDGHAAILAWLTDVLDTVRVQAQADPGGEGTRPRRLLNAITTGRARTGAAPLSPWATLRCSWRAARAAAGG